MTAERPALSAGGPASDVGPVPHPGDVRINVSGAFIVDELPAKPSPAEDPDVTLERIISHDPDAAYAHDTSDIRLPNQHSVVSHIAIDIGGSLAKLVYFSHEPQALEHGGRLNFLKFDTDRIADAIRLIRKLQEKHRQLDHGSAPRRKLCVMATGGGAFKYYEQITAALGVDVHREDEMGCLVLGLDFFISEIPNEVFTHNPEAPMSFLPPRSQIYPYLLVNIGSGVSMVKVSSPSQFVRIGGTSLGGGTLWGLLSLITGARSFDDMLALADKGDNTRVDMMVGDIYGTGYDKIGLKADTIASSFGKVYKMKREAERQAEDGAGLSNGDGRFGGDDGLGEVDGVTAFRPEDVSRSLLYAVSYNIGQIAYLQSCKHNLEHIYFGGSFIRGHRQTMNTLSYAIRYWSNNEKQAYFLRHEGYLGAVGAFLKRQPRNWGRRNSIDGTQERWSAAMAAASVQESPTEPTNGVE